MSAGLKAPRSLTQESRVLPATPALLSPCSLSNGHIGHIAGRDADALHAAAPTPARGDEVPGPGSG